MNITKPAIPPTSAIEKSIDILELIHSINGQLALNYLIKHGSATYSDLASHLVIDEGELNLIVMSLLRSGVVSLHYSDDDGLQYFVNEDRIDSIVNAIKNFN